MRTLVRVAAIVYVVYLAIALLLLTPALNLLPQWYMQDTYGRELRTGWVLFNPFKVSLDISAARLSDATGEPFIAFSEASVDLSLESLWQQGWVLDTLRIRDFQLEAARLTEDKYSFSDLIPADTGNEPEEPDSSLPGVTIHDLELHSETIVLTDRVRETAYVSRWNGLHFRVTDLSTVFEQGRPYSLDLRDADGGTLRWEGEVSLPKSTSSGHLSVSQLSLRELWRFAEPWLQFELRDGRLDIEGDYQLDWSNTFSYRISKGHVGLSAIDIVPVEPDQLPDTAVGLQTLLISNIAVDSTTQQVSIATVALDRVAVATWREGSGISLEQLFAVSLPGDPAEDATPEENEDDAGWTVALGSAQLKNSSLQWRSQLTDPAQLDVQSIEATAQNINWPLSGDTGLSLALSVNEQAKIAADGTLALADGNGSINYALDGLPLAWFNPNLPTALKASITGGEVEVKGTVALQNYAPSTITLDGAVRDFSARQEGAEVRLTGWDSVRFNGLSIDMDNHTLVLNQLAIDSYIGRLHIQKDGSINASNIWVAEVGDQAEEIAQELTEDKPWSFSVPVITITDSEIDFMDQSLPIQFRTVIGELEGEVLNISSASDAIAKVELKGSVDSYAPVRLRGTVSPFASPAALDLNLTFDGVDMALVSPYSGTYAGYAIDRGLLNLDLKYSLKNNHLAGDNQIRIEKLKLGKKVESEKAADLPLEFAIAILTDSNGIIDMAIPVSGDIDDPAFHLGSVISGAFVNIITKVITAPFTLLAGLVDSEEDLQRITFASGSAKLNDANREKLVQLKTALDQRPNLTLAITGRLNLRADRERLQKNALKVQLLENGLSAEEVAAKGPAWEEAIADQYEALPPTDKPESALPTSREQYRQVVQNIAISDEEMRALAEQRAVIVKGFMLNDLGLEPGRAVVGQVNLDEEDNAFSGVELGIEN